MHITLFAHTCFIRVATIYSSMDSALGCLGWTKSLRYHIFSYMRWQCYCHFVTTANDEEATSTQLALHYICKMSTFVPLSYRGRALFIISKKCSRSAVSMVISSDLWQCRGRTNKLLHSNKLLFCQSVKTSPVIILQRLMLETGKGSWVIALK